MDRPSDTQPKRRYALPPTSSALERDDTRPYFLWWTDCTVGELRSHLAANDPERSGYWLAALLREANSRDVWLFTDPDGAKVVLATRVHRRMIVQIFVTYKS